MSERFENVGRVTKVHNDGRVDILVKQLSACASCKASCSMAGEKSEKIFTINTDIQIKEGDAVKVTIDNIDVKRSAFITYLIPTVLLVSFALILQYFGVKDIVIALSSIAILVIYFLVVRLLLKNKKTDIKIEKLE